MQIDGYFERKTLTTIPEELIEESIPKYILTNEDDKYNEGIKNQ